MAKARILILSRRSIDPAIGGSALRVRNNADVLASFADARVLTLSTRQADRGLANISRVSNLIVFCSSRFVPGWLRRRLTHRPTRVLECALSDWKPDCVIFEECNLAALVDIPADRNIPIVYCSHNLEFQNKERLHGRGIAGAIVAFSKRRLLRAAEQLLLSKADAVWVCSEQESEALAKFGLARSKISIVPNSVDSQSYDFESQSLDGLDSPRLVYPATFDYGPNLEAAVYLLERVFPKIRQRFAGARLSLVGDAPPAWLRRRVDRVPGVELTGRVADVRDYLRGAHVMPVPLVHGGGTRLKILEAFAAGVPVVTTSKGVENLPILNGVHCLVHRLSEIAEAVERVLESPRLSETLRVNARAFVEDHYSRPRLAEALRTAVSGVCHAPPGGLA